MLTHKFFTLLMLSLITTHSYALPELGHVSQGGANIGNFDNHTAINQVTNKVVINWQSFNIGKKESVHFTQPANGIALNRINPAQGASQIAGKLTATGKIILMNAAGIHFTPTSVVNVGGIIATTANMTDKNFMAGHFRFTGIPGSSAAIINEGSITAAEHGFSALIAPHVENTGKINAHISQIPMYSKTDFVLHFGSNDLVHFDVKPEAVKKAIHKGTITANGEQIIVSAEAAKNILDKAVKIDHHAEAHHVAEHNGSIIFSAAPMKSAVPVHAPKDSASAQKNSPRPVEATTPTPALSLMNINEEYFSAPAEYTTSMAHPLEIVENHFPATPPPSPDSVKANEILMALQQEMDNFSLEQHVGWVEERSPTIKPDDSVGLRFAQPNLPVPVETPVVVALEKQVGWAEERSPTLERDNSVGLRFAQPNLPVPVEIASGGSYQLTSGNDSGGGQITSKPKLSRAAIPTPVKAQIDTDLSGKIIIHGCNIPGEDDEEDTECLNQQMSSAQWSVTWL